MHSDLPDKQTKFGAKNIHALLRYCDFYVAVFYFEKPCS